MKLNIDKELKKVLWKINQENKSDVEWAEIESSDLFQTDSYCGGYDADEKAFCFSYYSLDGKEYWFQFSLAEVSKALSGTLLDFESEAANKSN